MPIHNRVVIKRNTYDEWEVPTVIGTSGSDSIAFESSRLAAFDTARFLHGDDAVIVVRTGTYIINEEN